MPRIKRWFPVSHDINHSPTVRSLLREFGAPGLRIWLEILSIADRNGELIDCCSDGAISRFTSAAETRTKVTRSVLEALLKAGSIEHEGTFIVASCRLQGALNHATRVVNYREYHRTEEQKRVPTRPDLTRPDLIKIPLTRKKRITLPSDFVVTDKHREWARQHHFRSPDLLFDGFRDHHLKNGSKFLDWDAALRTWVRNDTERFGHDRQKTSDEPKGFAGLRDFLAGTKSAG